jgi:hypothetical protein
MHAGAWWRLFGSAGRAPQTVKFECAPPGAKGFTSPPVGPAAAPGVSSMPPTAPGSGGGGGEGEGAPLLAGPGPPVERLALEGGCSGPRCSVSLRKV